MSCDFYIAPPMVAYAFVPSQTVNMNNLYAPDKGLARGTIFPCLDKPLGVYGKEQMTCGGVKKV